MESPVFKLEGIVKSKSEPSDFEGPLSLILLLLGKNKVEIRDISISLILEQYMQFLDEMSHLDLDIASEFITMASHLTYIKTKMLLSRGEDVSELEQLITSLEELQRGDVYLQIKSVANTLSGLYSLNNVMMPGPPEYLIPDDEYRYIHESDDLLEAVFRVIGKETAVLNSINPHKATYPQRIVFSIPEKINEILDMLKQNGSTRLVELFFGSSSRTELIATLIAVLELCRVGSVLLTGGQDDITVSFTGVGREPLTQDFTEE